MRNRGRSESSSVMWKGDWRQKLEEKWKVALPRVFEGCTPAYPLHFPCDLHHPQMTNLPLLAEIRHSSHKELIHKKAESDPQGCLWFFFLTAYPESQEIGNSWAFYEVIMVAFNHFCFLFR